METRLSTTPFGRRSLTLAHVASQAVAKARPPEKAVHKWNIFRAICTAKNALGVLGWVEDAQSETLKLLAALLLQRPLPFLRTAQLSSLLPRLC